MIRKTTKQRKLKPCPFCGSKEPDVDPTFSRGYSGEGIDRKNFVSTGCFGCGTCGPDKPTEAEAIEAWNTRPKRRKAGR